MEVCCIQCSEMVLWLDPRRAPGANMITGLDEEELMIYNSGRVRNWI